MSSSVTDVNRERTAEAASELSENAAGGPEAAASVIEEFEPTIDEHESADDADGDDGLERDIDAELDGEPDADERPSRRPRKAARNGAVHTVRSSPGAWHHEDVKAAPRLRQAYARPETAEHEVEDTREVADLLDVLLRNIWLIAAIVLLSLTGGWLLLSRMTPLYTAEADILIESQRPTLATLEAVLPILGLDDQSIVSETVVLTSGVLLGSVVDSLGLIDDPEFNSAIRPPGGLDRILISVGLGSDSTPAIETWRPRVVNALAERISVSQVPDSRVISVRVTSESPAKASLIANTLVERYLESHRERKAQASSETNAWLETRIADLQSQLLESEQRVEAFRSQADLLETGGTTLISQQLAEVSTQLATKRAATAAAEARLANLTELLNSPDSSRIYSSSEVLQSQLIRDLRGEQVTLQREVAELSSELGPGHPRMQQLRADEADLRNQIAIEVDKVVQGLRNEVAVAQASEAEIERQVANLTSRLSQTNEDEIQLRALEREAEANRGLLETLLARQKELGSPGELQTTQSDARVTSYASAPTSPSFPQMGISMAAVFVVSMILALVIAFVREIRRKGFVSVDQLEAVSKLTVLGFVPLVNSRRQRRKMLDLMIEKPALPFAQALRTLNWQLDDSMPPNAQVILVTSAEPGEGKTTTSIGLARVKALKGHKTLLIDADIRDPSVHTSLGQSQTPGLRDVLENNAKLADCLVFDRMTSLDILPAGAPSVDALSLVDSPRMDSMMADLVDQYDFIIIDSPPVSAAPDACALSKIADTTVMTVRWMRTTTGALKYALRILYRNGGHLTGTVLTMVDTSKRASQSYGYFGYYGSYGQYGEQTNS